MKISLQISPNTIICSTVNLLYFWSHVKRKPVFGGLQPDKDSNWPVQVQKLARVLKLWI